MKRYKSDSAHDIIYVDYSTSGISAQPYQCSAEDSNLSAQMRNSILITHVEYLPHLGNQEGASQDEQGTEQQIT